INSEKTKIEEQIYHLENEALRDNKEIEDLDNQINYNAKQIETLNELIKSIRDSNKGFVNKLKAMFNSEEDESYKNHNKEKQQLLTQQLELEKFKKIKHEELVSKLKEKENLFNH
ncbi:ATPase, partial [Staphylococcus argenteus]|nr:ATPase [Staphylococcus argenteus]